MKKGVFQHGGPLPEDAFVLDGATAVGHTCCALSAL